MMQKLTEIHANPGRDQLERVRDLSITRPIKVGRSCVIERGSINRGRAQAGPYPGKRFRFNGCVYKSA